MYDTASLAAQAPAAPLRRCSGQVPTAVPQQYRQSQSVASERGWPAFVTFWASSAWYERVRPGGDGKGAGMA